MPFLYYTTGDLEKSYEVMGDTVEKAVQTGLIQQYSSPWILEIFYEFHKHRFAPLPHWNYLDIMETTLNGINVHLRGVALRLRAQEKLDQGIVKKKPIMADLEASRTCLELSGNHIQLAKTVLEMAHIELLNNNKRIGKGVCTGGMASVRRTCSRLLPGPVQGPPGEKAACPGYQIRQGRVSQALFRGDEFHQIQHGSGRDSA